MSQRIKMMLQRGNSRLILNSLDNERYTFAIVVDICSFLVGYFDARARLKSSVSRSTEGSPLTWGSSF